MGGSNLERAALARVAAAALCAALVSPVPASETTDDLGLPHLDVQRDDGLDTLSIVVPGRLVSYALPRSGGRRTIALLVAPKRESAVPPQPEPEDDENDDTPQRLPACPPLGDDDARMTLYRVEAEGEPRVISTRAGLPNDCTALESAEIDAEPGDELMLARPGALMVADRGGLQAVLEDPELQWTSLHPRITRRSALEGRPLVTTEPLGGIRLFGPDESSGGWAGLASVELPVTGRVRGNGLTVRNPIPRLVGAGTDGALVYATHPEALGKRRLSVSLVRLGSNGVADVTECWARLPEPEEVLESYYLMVDSRPMLLVTTKPADKLSLFGEKRLRLFALERDRSRLGLNPVWATESRMNLWQRAHPTTIDVNADGREDLVIGYWKGLKDGKVVLDVYLREDDGWFDDDERTTALKVEPQERERPRPSESERSAGRMSVGDRSFLDFGHDLDGDGLADLLLRAEDYLLFYPGLESSSGKKLITSDAVQLPSISLGGKMDEIVVEMGARGFRSWTRPAPGRPRLADLDGDGSDEVFVVHRGHHGQPDVLSVLFVRP